jgi:hypothetical protein
MIMRNNTQKFYNKVRLSGFQTITHMFQDIAYMFQNIEHMFHDQNNI